MSDLRQSPQYAKYLESIGWKIEKFVYPRGTSFAYVYLKHLPILGWFAKIQRPIVLNNKIIDFVESKYHPFQISVEPARYASASVAGGPLLKKLGFKKADPSLPTKTLQIDITKSEKELLKSFSQKTRYNIHLAEKKQVKVIESKNILDFTKFWRQNFEKKRFPILSQQKNIIAIYKAFGKKSRILLAKKSNKIIAVLFLLSYDKAEYYMHAASNDEGRQNFAPTLLTWNAILLAKKQGCKIFDFDGIYDERFPIKSWLGFTKFKKGFGGTEIEYPGCFTKRPSIFKIFFS